EAGVDGLESGAPVGGLKHVDVAPDLRLAEAAAVGENAHHRPRALAPAQPVADLEAGELLGRSLAHDHFVLAGLEAPAFNEAEVAAHREAGGLHAAQRHVGVGPGGALGHVDDDEQLGGGQGPGGAGGGAEERAGEGGGGEGRGGGGPGGSGGEGGRGAGGGGREAAAGEVPPRGLLGGALGQGAPHERGGGGTAFGSRGRG